MVNQPSLTVCAKQVACKHYIDISKHSKCDNWYLQIYTLAWIRTRDLLHPKQESYLYTTIAGLLHRILAFIDMKVSQVQPTLS